MLLAHRGYRIGDRQMALTSPDGEPESPDAPQPRQRGLSPVAAIVIVVMVLGGVGVLYYRHSHATFKVTGTMTISGTPGDDLHPVLGVPGACEGIGGYDDLVPGAQVILTDSASHTLALGSVGWATDSKPGATSCTLPFEVDKVPAGKRFYGVQIGHRGAVQYTEAQLKDGPALTIGS